MAMQNADDYGAVFSSRVASPSRMEVIGGSYPAVMCHQVKHCDVI